MPKRKAISNVLQFPSTYQPVADGECIDPGIDLNALLVDGRTGVCIYEEGDGYEIRDAAGKTIWTIGRVGV